MIVFLYLESKNQIQILGEYDTLPGLSQKNVLYKILNNTRAGHGCGPKIIEKAHSEFIQKRGKNFKYIPLLGDRKPASNYRVGAPTVSGLRITDF